MSVCLVDASHTPSYFYELRGIQILILRILYNTTYMEDALILMQAYAVLIGMREVRAGIGVQAATDSDFPCLAILDSGSVRRSSSQR